MSGFDSIRDFSSHICPSLVQPIIPMRNRVHEAIASDQVVFAAFLSNANLRMVDAVIRRVEVDDGEGEKILFGPAAAFIDYEHAPLTTREVEDLVIYLHSVLVENIEESPQGSDIQGLSADLLDTLRRRNLSASSLAAYERTWTRFLA